MWRCKGRLGIVHHTIRFLHRCGQHWGIVGERLSVCVRVYQHLSCLLLRCAGSLLCQGTLISASKPGEQTETHPLLLQTKPSLLLTFFFHKVYLLHSLLLSHLILPHLTPCNPCTTPYSPLLEWIWSESSLNRISTDLTKKGLDLPQHMLPFFQSSGRVLSPFSPFPLVAVHNCSSGSYRS